MHERAPTSRPSRRVVLRGAGAVLALASAARALPRHLRPEGLLALAEELAALPPDAAVDEGRALLDAGLPWRDLLGAIFLAGLRHVRPRPVGFKLHCVLVVESVFQLAERAPTEAERRAAVLWNLRDLKRSQDRDVAEGDWRLGPAPEPRAVAPERAARELAAALASRDDERIDRAAADAAAALADPALFELFWPVALADFGNLGHKPIFAAHVRRVLARLELGTEERSSALRALAHGLASADADPAHEEFDAAREAEPRLRADWRAGRREPAESLALAEALLEADPAGARALVLEASADGLDAETLWDGVRLAATDAFARRPSLLPVHPTTVASALRSVQDLAQEERLGRLALLQAAAWQPLYRDALGLRSSGGRPGLASLVAAQDELAGERVGVPALFDEPTRERALACLADPAALAPFGRELGRRLFRGDPEHHQPKYAAVLLEDADRAAERWRPVLLAAALDYLPT